MMQDGLRSLCHLLTLKASSSQRLGFPSDSHSGPTLMAQLHMGNLTCIAPSIEELSTGNLYWGTVVIISPAKKHSCFLECESVLILKVFLHP